VVEEAKEEMEKEVKDRKEKKRGGRRGGGACVSLQIHMIKQFCSASHKSMDTFHLYRLITYTSSTLGSYKRRAFGFFFSITKNCSFCCAISSTFEAMFLMFS